MGFFSDLSPTGKVIAGIGCIAMCPFAVSAAITASATVGTAAILATGVSEAVVLNSGLAAAAAADAATKAIGLNAIKKGLDEI